MRHAHVPTGLLALALLLTAAPAAGQVVTTTPSPPRTDRSVTVTFHADEGTEGLKDFDGAVYAHTGISTDQNPTKAWKCVKNDWPLDAQFTGNRDDTQLTRVGPNTYELVISDIRAYYRDTNTGCNLAPDEEIQTMNFVFRSAEIDGTVTEGKAAGGADIFVDVADVAGGTAFAQVSITAPQSSPPLYPFITSTDRTVTVSVAADTANVDALTALQLVVDGDTVASTSATTLDYGLSMDTPNRYRIEALVTADAGTGALRDTATTELIRTPDVTTQPRPPGATDGINYNDDGSVTLSLYAPNKDFVYLLGDFNDWALEAGSFMKKDGDRWWITLPAAALQPQTEYAFQYFVDGQHRIADPFSHKVLTPNDRFIDDATYPDLKAYPDSLTEGFVSVLETGRPDFSFDNPDFTPPPQDEMVVYELLLRDFLEQSDFQTLTDTLDYLDRLGINAIELMPVAEFGGNNSWGYNPTFHFALDKAYGPRTALKKFVQAAHNRGIAVILDVVYNHIDTQSPLVQLYGTSGNPFLEEPQDCGPFEELDQGRPFIQNYIDRANRYWIETFNVDGFRFDLAHCIANPTDWKTKADYVWNTVDPDTYMILEYFGDGLNQLANDGLLPWYKLNPQYLQSAMGYPGDNANLEPAYFGFAPEGFTAPNIMAYMESHDEQWLMHKTATFGNSAPNGYDATALPTALDRQKLVGAFFFTVPGPRMTWQFAELGYGYRPDECLNADDNSDTCGPEAPGRTAPKPIRWAYRDPQQSPNRVALYKTWQALLRLRNDYEVFSKARSTSNNAEGIKMKANTGDVVRCIRLEDEALDALIVGNFGVTVNTASVAVGTNEGACSVPQTGTWHNFFEDRERPVTGPQTLRLRPGEFRIYTSAPQPPPPMGLVPSAPTHRRTVPGVSGDGIVDFGPTGVDIDFAGTSGTGPVTVEALDEPPLDVDDIGRENVSAYRFVIEAAGTLDPSAQTTVRFDVGTLAGISTPENVTVYRRPAEDAGAFTALPTSYDGTTNELVATTGAFSEFVLASNTEPLPVELAAFDAAWTGAQTVRLTWQTGAETNNAGFEVQRRVDAAPAASGWTDVGFVEGAGTTETPQSYRFEDTVPFVADSVEYRLKQVDTDGRTRLSAPVQVTAGAPDRLALAAPYPNPTRTRATVPYAVPGRQPVSLALYDVLGRKIRTLVQGPRAGRHRVRLDVSSLSSGVYLLRLKAGAGVRTERLTVVR